MDAPLNLALDDLEDRFGLSPSDDAIYDAFTSWADSEGRPLYPHQDEALLAAINNDHLIVSTPTGSGKSTVAVAALFAGLARGKTGYYTAPLKALVSEKFFDLIGLFGAANVGMVTGDSAINPTAPIVCCTAEILANIALRDGADAGVDIVIADEFHFYSEPDRGWAWQIPLLELTTTQHVLLSATLGDTTFFEKDLHERTDRPVTVIADAPRPVPLSFSYSLTPLNETVKELVETHRTPAYVVHFTQAGAVSSATEFQSIALVSKDDKKRIAAEIGDFHFGTGFGRTLSKLVRSGIGVHHAGMLPRYRRLVERLAQTGLLKVICGTDTLGVGINVPIRTVVLTSLVKFDGQGMRQLTAREFHQVAGRAGRAGFDTTGEVVVQGPDHDIENAKAEAKGKKGPKKKPEPGQVSWTRSTFERLVAAEPETLTPVMRVSHAMILQLLQRGGDPVAATKKLLMDNHMTIGPRNRYLRRATDIYSSLRRAGLILHRDRQWRREHPGQPYIELAGDVPTDFALNTPLSPFALASLELLDKNSSTYALDVLSIIEAVQEDPMPILLGQRRVERDRAMAAMKAEGLDYNERMARLDEISWPQPLADLLAPALEIYRSANPWVAEFHLSPKSVVREMIEHSMTFTDLVSRYDANRSEGVVLRYLTDTYRALMQIVPDEYITDELDAIMEWLSTLVTSVDSSLLAEWQALADGAVSEDDIRAHNTIPQGGEERAYGAREDGTIALNANPHALRTAVRAWLWRFVEAAANDDVERLAELSSASGSPFGADEWDRFLDGYFETHEWLGADTDSRSARFVSVVEDVDDTALTLAGLDPADYDSKRLWLVTQTIDDGAESRDASLVALVDVGASTESVVATLVSINEGES